METSPAFVVALALGLVVAFVGTFALRLAQGAAVSIVPFELQSEQPSPIVVDRDFPFPL